MNQDALERLRNRAKPTVQSRDLSTIPSVSNNEEPVERETSLGVDEVATNETERTDLSGEEISPFSSSSLAYDRDNNINISNSSNRDVEISTITEAKRTSRSSSLADNELSSSSMDIKTKQSTIRLEQQLSLKLSQKCQEEEISREVFLEALFVYFENHKSIQSKVLQEARQREQQRQKIANYRRAKSMIERFGSE
jgi:hypothetical protein